VCKFRRRSGVSFCPVVAPSEYGRSRPQPTLANPKLHKKGGCHLDFRLHSDGESHHITNSVLHMPRHAFPLLSDRIVRIVNCLNRISQTAWFVASAPETQSHNRKTVSEPVASSGATRITSSTSPFLMHVSRSHPWLSDRGTFRHQMARLVVKPE
jgi:hypothetical protein